MRPYVKTVLFTAVLYSALSTAALAQGGPTPVPPGFGPPQGQGKPLTALKVQVVLSRYEGDKKVSSLPYVLSVTANEGRAVNLRMGSQVPIPQPVKTEQGSSLSYTYMNVGTNIDCSATSTDDGRFKIEVGIEDSSVMERRATDLAPTLRNFTARNSMVLKDGQTSQFTLATDKTTGDVVKVDVTLTVEK